MSFDYDRFLVDQLVRPVANLYRISPLAAGDTPAGGPVAYVRQKKLAIKEDIRFYADEAESQELFRVKARSLFDIGGARYEVTDAEGNRIGVLWHKFKESLVRSTWHVAGPDETEMAVARERSVAAAVGRRVVDFVPYVGGFVPIPYNFEILRNGDVVGDLQRRFKVRDQYVLDLGRDRERAIDRRVAIALAIALDALQNR